MRRDGTGVWLKTPMVWLAMLETLNLLFSRRLGGVGGWNRSLAEDPQGLAGNDGDLELTFLLETGWSRQMEQESG
jgi:hypothetical protein